MPVLRIRDNTELVEQAYRVLSFDKVLLESVITEEEIPYNKIIDDVVEACDKNYITILNKNLVKIMIDNVTELYPGVVEDIITEKISYLEIKQELKRLLEEGKTIRNLIGILEEMELNL